MKIFRLLFVICLLLAFAVSMQAAYTVFKSVPFTARVTILGSTNYNFAWSVVNRFTLVPTTNIVWTNINVQTLGANKLRIANQFIQLNYTNGGNNWGLSISSWNTNGVYNVGYKYTGPAANAAGLVQTNNPGNSALQLVWQIQDLSSYNTGTQVPKPILTAPFSGAFTNSNWSWKYMLDREQAAWINTSVNTNVGTSTINYYAIPIFNSQKLWGSGAGQRNVTLQPAYIFFGADFTTASPTVYKTTALMIDMYHP